MNVNWNFLLLIQGISAYFIGSQFFNMIAILWLTEIYDSGRIVGFFQFSSAISITLCMPIGGILADRLSRIKILIFMSFCSSISTIILVILFFTFEMMRIIIVSVFIINILLSITSSFFIPSVFSFLPDILPADRLSIGNAIMRTSLNVSQIIGRACCGLLFTLIGVPIMISITGLIFFLSGLLELFIKLPKNEKKDTQIYEASNIEKNTNILSSISHGCKYVVENKSLIIIFLVMIGLGCCLGILTVNTPFLIKYHFKIDFFWYGYFLSCLSAGFIFGAIYAGFLFNNLDRRKNRINLFIKSVILCPIFCILLGLIKNDYIGLLVFFLIGATYSVVGTIVTTQLQLTVPNHIRGRVISIGAMLFTVVSPLSGFFAGILIDIFNKDVALIQWLSNIIIALLIYPLLIKKELKIFLKKSY